MTVRYTITLEPNAHRFHVQLDLAAGYPEGLTLAMAAWVPGSYMIRDLARHVVAIHAECAGAPLPLHKIRKDHWRLAPCAGPVRIHYQVYALDRSVRTACLDQDMGFFNGPAMFLRVLGEETVPHEVQLSGPEAWQVATALPRSAGAEWSWGQFTAPNYPALCDHPVLMGSLDRVDFQAGGYPHHLALQGHPDANHQALGRDLARICSWQQAFWGESPFSSYTFLCMGSRNGYGGLEHRGSSALLCSREDLWNTDKTAYKQFLGLVSHEYFHSWMVQAIRPAVLAASDGSSEALTRDLWVFEGITSYYDDFTLRRCGLLSVEEWLGHLAREMTRLAQCPGERLQSVAESSEDAWIKLYHPHANSKNFTISYYNKGALLALCLDLRLRLAGHSLDLVLQELWQDYGRPGRPLPEGELPERIAVLAGPVIAQELKDWIHTPTPLPLETLLAEFGVLLDYRAAEPVEAGDGVSLGAQWKTAPLGVELGHVLAGAAAEQAGLCPGDILLSVDHELCNKENLPALLQLQPAGRERQIHYLRDGRLYTGTLRPLPPPCNTARLQLAESVNAEVRGRRQAWLGEELSPQTKG